jgi:hypothetical protein
MKPSNIVYVLDKHDRILSLDGDWDRFVHENDGVNLYSQDVCGRKIWDFISGDATRMWLETVFQFVRLRGAKIERPYRCDSPHLKRFMRMRIHFIEEGMLRLEHEILATEQRFAPVHITYGAHAQRNARQRCSICGRVNNGGWREPTAELAHASAGILVIYTVCEDCQRLMPGT